MKKPRFTLLFVFLLVGLFLSACTGSTTTTASWPGLMVDAEREIVYLANGSQIFAVNMAGGSEKWRFPVEPDSKISFYAAPELTEDGQLLVVGYDGVLYSLDPSNGQQNWTFTGAQSRYIAAPAVSKEIIFAPNSDTNLYVLNQAGSLRWQYEVAHVLWGKPVVNDQVVYLPSMDHHMYALEIESGDLVWQSEDLGGAIAGNPTLGPNDVLYVGTLGAELLALDKLDGRVLWRSAAQGWVWSGPALNEDTLYFGDLSGALFAVSAADGSPIWQVQPDSSDDRAISGKPFIVGDTLYIVTKSGNIYAIDKTTGNTRWSRAIDKAKLYGAPVIAGDALFVAPIGAEAILYAFDLNGNPSWQFKPAK